MLNTNHEINSRKAATSFGLLTAILVSGFMLAACGTHKVTENAPLPEAPQKIATPQTADLDAADMKKKEFFNSLRPMIESENARISSQRDFLLGIQHKHQSGKRLTNLDQRHLKILANAYGIDDVNVQDKTFWQEMVKRVDIVPVELFLAQAANESAWGTSRFAKEGNNYFGQWCFNQGCGMVPKSRPAGATYEVASYDSPAGSVSSYVENLNTSKAYEAFRDLRAKARSQNRPLEATELAWGLLKYSERGKAYVRDIQAMILANRDLMA